MVCEAGMVMISCPHAALHTCLVKFTTSIASQRLVKSELSYLQVCFQFFSEMFAACSKMLERIRERVPHRRCGYTETPFAQFCSCSRDHKIATRR